MPQAPHRVGLYFAVVLFFFTITWTIYALFLPKLAAQAGIPKHYVVFILLVDQLIFIVMDFAMGVAADRISHLLGRLGLAVLGVTLVSCLAFLLLPLVAPQGSMWLFLGVTLLWTATSSALRAPPMVLLGKHAPQPQVPMLASLSLLGVGLAGAAGPYLTAALRDVDPRAPFALSSVALALATAGIVWAERTLASAGGSAAQTLEAYAPKPRQPVVIFLFAVLLLAIGFQVHFSLNSAPLYLKFAKPPQLEHLMPVFWIGFAVLMVPASLATKRYGGVAVAALGGLIAAAAAYAAHMASSLPMLVAMQFLAGGGWGFVLMSAVSAAIAIGHTGREGKLTGGLFALLAAAAFARIAVAAAELAKDPAIAQWLTWVPVAAWGAGGVVLLLLFASHRKALAPAVT
ncbi:MAG: MFS transporter [Burkholderiales bacterium]